MTAEQLVEHVATFTDDQLATLAASTDPAHLVAGYAATCELAYRQALAASATGRHGRSTRAAARVTARTQTKEG